ncbi:MAG: hypothetical protein CMJ35_09485 [Phycisphaerae bacterium]|mgnify:CR=1 FL=1|nr:hypothetical protein [Phycisphaerae bacterium]
MTHRTLQSRFSPIQFAVLAGATLSLCFVAGCGDSAEAEAAVKKAGRTFNSIAVGDATTSPSYSQTQYTAAEQSLSQYAGSDNGFAEAAAVGVAVAKKGQAALASQRAASVENESRQQARVIRGMINEWLTMSAISQAAGMFDPTDGIIELQEIIELREEDIANYRREMQQINDEIAQHETKMADLRALASEQRNEAGGLELKMPRVSAQEAAELAKQVREYSLRADQYELEAMRIEGIVDQLRPGAREVSLNVEKARSQIELLGKATQELRDRAAASQNDARQALDNAEQAKQRITEALSAYQSFRDNEVQDASDEAISLVRGAITALRDANDAVKQVAALSKADAQQMLAEFAMRQAAGEREEAMLYMAIKDAKLAGNWDTLIDAANQKADELEEMGRQAFIDSASSLRSAHVRGDAADRIEATALRLEALGGLEPEPEYEDPSSEPEFEEETETLDESGLEDLTAEDLSDMSLEEFLATLPEESREMMMQQFESQLEMLNTIDDPEMLYQILDQIDEQAAAMPEELAIGFEFVRQQIQKRIDELESEG